MRIYLVGLPGSGKSTLGKELSKFLQLTFIDTDAEIVKSEDKSIEAIFKESGETYFRNLEQVTLQKLSTIENAVISTGGGTPCFFDNIEFMNKTGIVIFIDVPVETIHARLTFSQAKEKRPMLEGKSSEEVLDFVKTKYKEREPFYSKAKIRIKGSNIKTAELVERIQALTT